MKKPMAIMLGLCAVIVALACGSNEPEVDGTTEATDVTGGEGGGTAKGKMLVIYFSRAGENWQVGVVERGNTAIMVDYIQALSDVDVFEIVPETAYPQGYEDTKTVATAEFNDNARPAIKTDITNIADYETVFIGGPVWWARPPMIFRTFFEAHPELNGKTIIPFDTHGGSSIGSYKTLIQEYYPNATVLESLGISGSSIRNASSKTTVEDWLKRLGVDRQSTSVLSSRARTTDNDRCYSLNGIRIRSGRFESAKNSQRGIYIKNNKKYISK